MLGNGLKGFRLGQLFYHMPRYPCKHRLSAVGLQLLRVSLQHLDEGAVDLGRSRQPQAGYCPLGIARLGKVFLQDVRASLNAQLA